MRRTSVGIGSILVAFLATACGGGGNTTPTSPSTPPVASAPAPAPSPSPSGITVYASSNNRVSCSVTSPADCDTLVVTGGVMGAGWQSNEYVTEIGTGAALRFDLPSEVAGHTVTKAVLRLYVDSVPTDFVVRPELRVGAFASAWDPSTLTWNIWADLPCHETGELRVPAPSSIGPMDFDVTTVVANWASGTWRNDGLKVWVDKPGPGEWGRIAGTWFRSLTYNDSPTERPQLVVDVQ